MTPIFMHVNILHIFFNMWWLIALGHHDRGPPRDAPAGCPGLDLGGRLQLRPVPLRWSESIPASRTLFGGMSGVVYAPCSATSG